MYLYETHCHTAPVSKCGKASAEETVRFYKKMGYDGLFITNHFLDGNINLEVWNWPYAEQIDYYFSDYEKAAEIGKEVGIKVFPGVELSYPENCQSCGQCYLACMGDSLMMVDTMFEYSPVPARGLRTFSSVMPEKKEEEGKGYGK